MNNQSKILPPVLANWLLSKSVRSYYNVTVLADLEEEYEYKAEREGIAKANRWYWRQAIKSIPHFLLNSFAWGGIMFRNYLKFTFRNMLKHKSYSMINISGLALGMVACLIIGIYVFTELSYDNFHANYHKIYRVGTYLNIGESPFELASSNFRAGREINAEIPEVESVVMLRRSKTDIPIEHNEQRYYESGFVYADSTFFNVFSFRLLIGDPNTALKNPWSLVITEEIAEKYFGNENPVGKVVLISDQYEYTITGLVEKPPYNSHIDFTMLASFVSLKPIVGGLYDKWFEDFSNHTYILLNENTPISAIENKLAKLVDENLGEMLAKLNAEFRLQLEPLEDIYLYSNFLEQIGPSGDINNIYLFSTIAVLILLIACVNFINLSTARSMMRFTEIGVRKVHGAQRIHLILQFMGESIIYSGLSLFIALLLLPLFWPVVYELTGLSIEIIYDQLLFLGLLLIVLLFMVGAVAGFYPALYLSAKMPVEIIKGKKIGSETVNFRRVLVITQFVISICLIGATGIIDDQMNYFQNKNHGYKKENMLVVHLYDQELSRSNESIIEELRKNTNIVNVAFSEAIPGNGCHSNAYLPEGNPLDETVMANNFDVDYNFISTMGLEIIEGRNFSRKLSTDEDKSVIINETAAKRMGWRNPIGKTLKELDGRDIDKTVIGVVKDFHFDLATTQISPLIIDNINSISNILVADLNERNIEETINYLEKIILPQNAKDPLSYYFLDTYFENEYYAAFGIERIITYFTILAIFLACLGLFGLAAFSSERRTKEIGIRKTLGASISTIIGLLARDFIKWVVIACLIAWPIIWFGAEKWLENYPYRTDVSVTTIILTGVITIGISLITVIFQTIKSARSNPVDSLKYE